MTVAHLLSCCRVKAAIKAMIQFFDEMWSGKYIVVMNTAQYIHRSLKLQPQVISRNVLFGWCLFLFFAAMASDPRELDEPLEEGFYCEVGSKRTRQSTGNNMDVEHSKF